MSNVYDLADSIPCSYCGADRDEKCRTRSGATASMSHSARVEPIRLGWVDGFHEGQRDVVGALDSGEWGRRYVDRIRRAIEAGIR